MSGEVFDRRLLAGLAVVGVLSLLVGAVAVLIGPGEPATTSGADAFSRSAIGHRAFVSLLRAEGVPVVVSRYDSDEKAVEGALLVAAEPQAATDEHVEALLELIRDLDVLVVLPKWRGSPGDRRGWLATVEPVPLEQVERVAAALGVGAPRRGSVAGPWTLAEGLPAVEPALTDPQLLAPESLPTGFMPVVHAPEGVLFGWVSREGGGLTWVLSDPDLLANHGLLRAGNAALALALLELARDGGAVVVDETLHGHTRRPSLGRALVEPPLLYATVQAALLLGVALWGGVRRFGAPAPPPAALGQGRAVLIHQSATLLRDAGHGAHALHAYWHATRRALQARLRIPPDAEGLGWLAAAARARGVRLDVAGLDARVARVARRGAAPAEIVALARQIHRVRSTLSGSPPTGTKGV